MKPRVQALQKAEYFVTKHDIGKAGNIVLSLNLLMQDQLHFHVSKVQHCVDCPNTGGISPKDFFPQRKLFIQVDLSMTGHNTAEVIILAIIILILLKPSVLILHKNLWIKKPLPWAQLHRGIVNFLSGDRQCQQRTLNVPFTVRG